MGDTSKTVLAGIAAIAAVTGIEWLLYLAGEPRAVWAVNMLMEWLK